MKIRKVDTTHIYPGGSKPRGECHPRWSYPGPGPARGSVGYEDLDLSGGRAAGAERACRLLCGPRGARLFRVRTLLMKQAQLYAYKDSQNLSLHRDQQDNIPADGAPSDRQNSGPAMAGAFPLCMLEKLPGSTKKKGGRSESRQENEQ